MFEPLDLNGNTMFPGDRVIFARPESWSSKAAKLDYGTIMRFTATGVTLRVDENGHTKEFNTPYRANKFILTNQA